LGFGKPAVTGGEVSPAAPGSPTVDVPDAVVVYWRPGCLYCVFLRRTFRRAGLVLREVNIWEDRAAAALVRSVAGGNETVPTVVVGQHAFVNPAPRAVLDLVRNQAPHLLPNSPAAGRERRRRLHWGRRRQ
jgi:glutaredoxin